ncbi:MAG: hypothetical protein DDT19_00092 [Syntrophomonadaceae bacterium]|nr:hypothetical protein [Bacillota bacterium]
MSWIYDPDVLAFLLAVVVLAAWELAKWAFGRDFEAKLITSVNGLVAVAYAVAVSSALGGEFFEHVVRAGAVFAAGSLYDLLKSYGAVE